MRRLLASALAALACAAVASPAVAADEARLLVKLRPGADLAGLLAEAGAEREGRVLAIGVLVLTAPRGEARKALAELRSSPGVLYAERDRLVAVDATYPDDPLSGRSFWQHALPRFHAAWDLAKGRAGTVVAVLDTGISPSHADLPALAAGYDFVNRDATASDDNGHGTAVAGVVAARAGNGLGIAGTCWRCSLMPVKVMDANGLGWWSTVAEGIVWATDQGADVVNLSLGGAAGSLTLEGAVAYALEHDVVVVASAGNGGSTAVRYPAAYPGVVSVAATDSGDRLYDFSSRGDWVLVAAPGCTTTTALGGGFGSFCGTSASAPFVAGLAGLARSFAPSATGEDVAAALAAGAVGGLADVAYGRIDARSSLAALAALAAAPVNLRRPRVRGRKEAGSLVRARPGRWAGSVVSFDYRWKRCRAKRCVLVARGETYRVRARDTGRRLRLVVVARAETARERARSRRTRLVR